MEQDSFRSFLKPVQTDNEIRAVAEKASEIWHEHFTPILGEAQVNYMLDRFQSAQAISDAITREHYRYFFILSEDEEKVGYCAVQPRGDVLYLSKLYIAKPYRGRKLASAVIKTLLRDHAFSLIGFTSVSPNYAFSIGIMPPLWNAAFCITKQKR